MIKIEKNIILKLSILLSFCLSSQELSQSQINLLKNNPSLLDDIDATEFVADQINAENIEGRDKSIDVGIQTNDNLNDNTKLNKFGFDYIKSIPTSISSTSDLPVPNDYRISLGDKLRIILTGGKRASFDLKVGMDGSILFPELGLINIFGESLSDVRKKIKALVDISYVGTDVSVGLLELSAKKVNIIGAIKNPGTHIVNPFSTASTVLAYSGGFEDYASLRTIKILRNGEEINFDLYQLLIGGDRQNDLNIQQGDTIKIPASNNFISIEGAVMRPNIYQYSSSDTFEDLVNFALGFTSEADKNNIFVTEIIDGLRLTKKINLFDRVGNAYIEKLHVGTNVYVSEKNVFVDGLGVSKGFVNSNITDFKELISGLQFSSDIYPFYAIYEFETSKGLSRTKVAFSLADPETYEDFNFYKNSVVYFFDREFIFSLNELDTNITDGDKFNFREEDKYLLDTLIQSDFIDFKIPNLDISMPIKGRISPKVLHEYFGISERISTVNAVVITDSEIFSDAYLEVYDSERIVTVNIPQAEPDLITVSISGQILNPGTYKVSSSTTLDKLYSLAGGFVENAFQEGIIFTREAVKENQKQAVREARTVLADSLLQKSVTNEGAVGDINSIINLSNNFEPVGRITGDFYLDEVKKNPIILNDGDSIFIPSLKNEVTVQGEVLNSSSFLFDKDLSFKDYIVAAGGYTSYADKQEIFIIKANGTATKINRNIFSGNNIVINVGDTIVVPRDLDQIEGLPLVQAATNIISNIAFSAASLNAIRN